MTGRRKLSVRLQAEKEVVNEYEQTSEFKDSTVVWRIQKEREHTQTHHFPLANVDAEKEHVDVVAIEHAQFE